LIGVPCGFLVYDFLFVPRGSICMGVSFMFPLASGLALLAYEILLLARWIVTPAIGG